jgi:CBS domain containing-hemolysin-like protein
MFIAWCNGAVSELSQELYSKIIDKQQNAKISKIWDRYDDVIMSLFFWLFVFLMGGIFCLGISYAEHSSALPLYLWIIIAILSICISIAIIYLSYNLGKRSAEKTLRKLGALIYIITSPILPLLSKINKAYVHISGKSTEEANLEEITDLVEEAREYGSIDDGEYRILKNVMNFNEVLISDVMTPRTVLFACNADMTIGEIVKLPEIQVFSRFPIWSGKSIDDDVLGYVTTKDVFAAVLNGKTDMKLSKLARPIQFIPENADIGRTLDDLIVSKQQLYLVVDEYGGIEGIVTMEDIIETILGVEIVDEQDKVIDMRIFAKTQREKRIKEQHNLFIE